MPLNAAEGFIRQLIGWREYVRGIYWLRMPAYAELNHLHNTRPLPDFYWTGRTRMRCMAQVIEQTLKLGYAHHIQRLMVTGNFALLAGIAPTAICQWYLSVYMDAFDWVELPNTLGMVMHADGGYLGSKPYCASGRYIQRMSDHCKACSYKVEQATEADACPFNALYWHFLIRHRAQLAHNPRLALVYRNLDGMAPARREAVWRRGQALLARLDAGTACEQAFVAKQGLRGLWPAFQLAQALGPMLGAGAILLPAMPSVSATPRCVPAAVGPAPTPVSVEGLLPTGPAAS